MSEIAIQPALPPPAVAVSRGARWRRVDWRAALPLIGVTAVAAVLNTWALGQNGYANVYYSAGVKSMLLSWHNFVFISADPAGLISIDKPPLGLWLQAASAKAFGFSPLSLLLPQAIAGVAAVVALYVIVRKRYGTLAATIGALTLATFPAFVAVARDNNVDALLILLMTLACGAGLRATERGSLRALLGAAVLVALAFNTKALAAVLVVPGIGAAYLACAPGSLRRRLAHLLVAGALCALLSVSWMVAVDLTPAAHRPFVGSSTDNSELGLTFGYNGLGRAVGQNGGPGAIVDQTVQPQSGAPVPTSSLSPTDASVPLPKASPAVAPKVRSTITAYPVAFGASPGLLRLFRSGLGDQDAWLLAFALVGMLAIALARPGRRDPRLAGLIVLGGFFVCEALFLSVSKGIVHPYYASALGPGLAAMVGAGFAALARPGRSWHRGLILAAVGAAVAVQVVLLHQAHYLRAWPTALIAAASVGTLVAIALHRFTRVSLAAVLGVLLVAPTAYAATTWRQPVQGTFPAAGPRVVGGNGGAELSRAQLATEDALIRYVLSHQPGSRFQLLTEASLEADSPILLGLRAAALGGYGGTDPALDGPALGRLVASGQARYVLLGGGYAYRGGNGASRAAAVICPAVPLAVWRGAGAVSSNGLYLLDCAGEADELMARPG